MPPAIPLATYRLQLTADFDFDKAAAVVPYLKALGITHLYTSPVMKARKGSTHGYDTVDHSQFNPELGGEAGFAAKLGTELAVIDGVVAVGRALARLHHRRGVEMRDPECLEVRHDRGGLVEVEIRGELKPIGRQRNGRRHANLRDARSPTRVGADRR